MRKRSIVASRKPDERYNEQYSIWHEFSYLGNVNNLLTLKVNNANRSILLLVLMFFSHSILEGLIKGDASSDFVTGGISHTVV
jgi:hypothetical protein